MVKMHRGSYKNSVTNPTGDCQKKEFLSFYKNHNELDLRIVFNIRNPDNPDSKDAVMIPTFE